MERVTLSSDVSGYIVNVSANHSENHRLFLLFVMLTAVANLFAIAAFSKFASKYETEAVAALGIVKKSDQLPLCFSIGAANGLLPLLAYNFSSGNQKRRHDAFIFGSSISLGFSLLGLIVFASKIRIWDLTAAAFEKSGLLFFRFDYKSSLTFVEFCIFPDNDTFVKRLQR